MAFRKKAEHILPYSPDIVIVPECEHYNKIQFPAHFLQPTDCVWFGKNQHKGLAVFSFSHLRLNVLDVYNEAFRNIIPIAVTGGKANFNLFAVWANNPKDPDGPYITQVLKAITCYEALLTEKTTILMGDFNSNTIWDYKKRKLGNHSNMVAFLETKNIVSAYHFYYNQEQGKETRPTLFMYRHQDKPYHIDYCFISADLRDKLALVEVGEYKKWAQYSDHAPLIVDFHL